MLTYVERMIAWRYLRAKRSEGFISLTSWFAIIGIMLGVATLILVTSLMNGIREEMTSRFIGLDGHVSLSAEHGPFMDYETSVEGLAANDWVASVSPKVSGQVMASANGQALGAQVLAMPFANLMKRELITENVSDGSLKGLETGEGVVLGERLARNLGVSIGDTVTLISPQGQATFAGFIPRMKAYPVIATVKLGMHLYDSSLIIMPFEESQVYFKLGSGDAYGVSSIEIMLHDTSLAPQAASYLMQMYGSGIRAVDWQTANATVFSALKVQRNVMVLILALIVLVAAFNIISSLVMLVKEKGRSIAIMRTMGASRLSIMKIFMLCGSIIGCTGTLLGLGLGLVLADNIEAIRLWVEKLTGQELLVENIYFLSTLPTKTDPRKWR
jgi:lipoprotein-releasing system permease protein